MSEKMGKEELLKWLDGAEHERLIYVPHKTNAEQHEMYTQLVSIVKAYFSIDPDMEMYQAGYRKGKTDSEQLEPQGVEELVKTFTKLENHRNAWEIEWTEEDEVNLTKIKQLLTQNIILHKELKSLEENAFHEELNNGKALEWLDKLEDALATDNNSDYREAKSKLKKLLTQQPQRVTREDVENIAIDLKGEMIIEDMVEMVIAWLKELGWEVEGGEKIRLDIVQVKAEWVMDFIDGIDDVFKIERPYTFYVDIAAFFSPKNFVEYLNEKLKEHG